MGTGIGNATPVADAPQYDRPPLDVRLADRPRPGRVYYQATLIALLRDQSLLIDPATAEADEVFPIVLPVDPGEDTAHGIAIGTIIGASMWAGVIFAVWNFM
jgi:hypothetical protein